jgi:hypothetical protein
MKAICSRPRNGIDHSAGSLSVLRGVVARQYRKLLDGVHAQISSKNAAGRPIGVIVQADSIQTVIILLRARARDSQLLPETSIAAIRPCREAWLGVDGFHTGL